LFTPGRELIPGIHAVAASVHTPGHCAILVSSGNAQLLHVADTFHSQAFDLDHPDWATAFDLDPDQAYQTRLRLLDQAVVDRTLLMAYHMPFPAIGYVRANHGLYDCIPAPWLFNPNH
jgi:glyoxylase-like metal-dependent hydrolase (beta-lactamase superfamily II)